MAFSLALGEWLHSPVRAMDEPDVFMDNVSHCLQTCFNCLLEKHALWAHHHTPGINFASCVLQCSGMQDWGSRHSKPMPFAVTCWAVLFIRSWIQRSVQLRDPCFSGPSQSTQPCPECCRLCGLGPSLHMRLSKVQLANVSAQLSI